MVDLNRIAHQIYEVLLHYVDSETAMDLLEEIIDILEEEID